MTLLGHAAPVRALAVLPDGRVVSCSDDHTLRVWDVASGETVTHFTLDAPVTALAVIGARQIVVGGPAGGPHLFRIEKAAG